MKALSRHEIVALAERQGEVCVSLFVPTRRTGVEVQQAPIRLRNLLRRTEEQLAGYQLRSPDAKQLLAPAYALLNDDSLWRNQGDGLAVFLAPDFLRPYSLPLRFDEFELAAHHFYIRPLLPFLSSDERFHVLALSQNQIRLFECTPYAIRELERANVPGKLAEALRYDSPERHITLRTAGPAPVGGGRAAAMFYGKGNVEESKRQLMDYFRRVDEGLRELLPGDCTPMVLASVAYLHPIYRAVSQHPCLALEGIVGNPDHLTPESLHQKALTLLHAQFQKKQAEAKAQYMRLAHTKGASNDVSVVVSAAYQRRIGALFVNRLAQEWGVFDPVSNVVLRREQKTLLSDEELVNLAAIYTLARGGDVYSVEPADMPDAGPVAATFRY